MASPATARPTFDDLLGSNRTYAQRFTNGDAFDGIAHAGLAMLTCMDSRIEPLQMVGLELGDAKILRTPGGRLTADALTGCLLAVTLLGAERIMVVPHTRCAMTVGDVGLRAKLADQGIDAADLSLGGIDDPEAQLAHDVEALRTHPLIGARAEVAGFSYDVDTGLLSRVI